jgi:S1-C subfamily serine protease
VLVSHVAENNKAARAGLRAGDVIIEAGGNPVNNLANLIAALDGAAPVEITVSRRREKLKIVFQ